MSDKSLTKDAAVGNPRMEKLLRDMADYRNKLYTAPAGRQSYYIARIVACEMAILKLGGAA